MGDSYSVVSPASGPGYSPSNFPASAPPGGYDPSSAPPYQGQPGYPQPGYAQQPQGYQAQPPYPQQQPGYQGAQFQAPPPQRSRSFAGPLIALAGVAALLVVGIVVVVVVRASGGGGGGENSAIDKCLVGTWKVTSSKQKVVDSSGSFDLTGSGWTSTLRADGTGEVDYGTNTRISGTFNGSTVELRVSGSYTFTYATVNNTFTTKDLKVDGTVTYYVNGAQTTSEALSIDEQPSTYTCSGDKLTQSSSLYSVEMTRQ
ncbi:lipocalin family protein [Virgisporangium aliadipatigenens]|uniref:lipocalin family protein n=1 Tax=Virgisporangium aliadipatigenens TaxID=741659 RepID=UPI0019436B04|nr:lipocalin family protein [Virgisporangium aliadipatigenens]